MKVDRGFKQLLQIQQFTDNIISVEFDEAHCISTWGDFCSKYQEVEHLCYILQRDILIVTTSAMLATHVLNDVKDILQL